MKDNILSLIEKQRAFFETDTTKDVAFRKENLTKLKSAVKRYEQQLLDALQRDLHKSETEAYMTEIAFIYEEIRFVLKHLDSWTKPQKVKTPVSHLGSKSYLYREPYGVTLIIAPWNYPVQLQFSPLIGAIAGGNTALLKPSEYTPTVSRWISKLIQKTFPSEYIAVVEGGVEESQALLNERFDYIFFTGSVAIGKEVMKAAANYLTPLTLELGGKSPCIVDQDANIELAAKRIAWGKFTNASQTCIAPDYVIVHEQIREEFVQELKAVVKEFYGETPLNSEKFGKIVSKRHFTRLLAFLQDGDILFGGQYEEVENRISPTLLENIMWEDSVMKEEIFGPILPLFSFTKFEDLKYHLGKTPNPLALYYFSEDEKKQEKIINSFSFGGGCINDTVMHVANTHLPFGGVGESGMGKYHGKGSFDAFTHEKGILKQTTKFDLPIRYPSFKNSLKYVKKLLK
ncbi:aldehyde dehydrogenase [Priestia endophytica]|uniref:aldehyde dehydrogenase n=1 Tax=Priestia endophytica TaxID=135735 RepID=UPI002280CBC3|nr:aldehyde dehydrogenase [Priestia endophytica]MCY8230409.1 aldehyde dehydrogenase [Priestia endophytica]